MPRASITLNSKELDAQLKEALKRNPKETAKAATEVALDLAARSAKRAPIESGDLRRNCTADSGPNVIYANETATGVKITPSLKVTVSVGYSLPYALRQHEDLSLRHDRTDGYRRRDGTTVNMIAGGEAKYLERPFNERTPAYIERFAKIPDEVMK